MARLLVGALLLATSACASTAQVPRGRDVSRAGGVMVHQDYVAGPGVAAVPVDQAGLAAFQPDDAEEE